MRSCLRRPLTLAAAALLGTASLGAAGRTDDRPLQVIQPFASTFPETLLAEGITSGFVRAVIHIDAEGRLVDHLVLAYTHRELVAELLTGLREWEFTAPRIRGESVGTRADVIFSFEARGAVLSLSAAASATVATRWVAQEVVSLEARANELDQPLAVIQAAPPLHPGPALRPAQPTGSALLEFFVDAAGRPRLAVAVEATHDAFGAAAIDAVARWQFQPPTRAGRPVVVRVRQLFRFTDTPPQKRGTD